MEFLGDCDILMVHKRGRWYPTGFWFRWVDDELMPERVGQRCRQIWVFDSRGRADFGFEDGVVVRGRRRSVQVYDKDSFEDMQRCRYGELWYIRTKREVRRYEKYARDLRAIRSEKLKMSGLKKAEKAGYMIRDRLPRMVIGDVPVEIYSAVKYISALKGITMSQYALDALVMKIRHDVANPSGNPNIALRRVLGSKKVDSMLRDARRIEEREDEE